MFDCWLTAYNWREKKRKKKKVPDTTETGVQILFTPIRSRTSLVLAPLLSSRVVSPCVPLRSVLPPFPPSPLLPPSLFPFCHFPCAPLSALVCPRCPCFEARELKFFILHCSVFTVLCCLVVKWLTLLLSFFFFCPSTFLSSFSKPFFVVCLFSTFSLAFSLFFFVGVSPLPTSPLIYLTFQMMKNKLYEISQ